MIPHIEGEAEKIPGEIGKVLAADFPVSVRVHRVPVLDGHLASVFVRLVARPPLAEVRAAMLDFQAPEAARRLPSSPEAPVQVLDRQDGPQRGSTWGPEAA